MRVFELGFIVYSSFSLRKIAQAHLTQLRDKTGLTIFMGIAVENRLVYIEKIGGTGIIQISSGIGWRVDLHFGMLGMVLMAYLPEGKVEEILKQRPLQAYTPYSITDPHAFALRLAEIRNQGIAIEYNEAHEGLIGIAAPVRDHSRNVIAAVGVAVPLSRNQGQREVQQIAEAVKATADAISSDLGYLKV
jgi:DNA-binding IclR family transcriptional regulator